MWTSKFAPMLTPNIYIGALIRKRHTFTGWQLFGVWCFLYAVLEATPLIVLSTDHCNLEFQCISLPSELLTVSGVTAPAEKIQALQPGTAQAILARAQRLANFNSNLLNRTAGNPAATPAATPAPQPVALFATAIPSPLPHPIVTHESSDEEETNEDMASISRNTINPRMYQGAFHEASYIIKHYTKSKTMKKGSRIDEDLLAAQTDEVMEARSSRIHT